MHEDYDEVRARWERSTGIGLNESETREAIGLFLTRNPGLSLVVLAPKVQWRARCWSDTTVGAVICTTSRLTRRTSVEVWAAVSRQGVAGLVRARDP